MHEEEEVVSEAEIDALGIKKKDDAEVDDVIGDVDDAAVDPDLIDPEEKEDIDGGIFGDDKELEEYMLGGYEDNY